MGQIEKLSLFLSSTNSTKVAKSSLGPFSGRRALDLSVREVCKPDLKSPLYGPPANYPFAPGTGVRRLGYPFWERKIKINRKKTPLNYSLEGLLFCHGCGASKEHD